MDRALVKRWPSLQDLETHHAFLEARGLGGETLEALQRRLRDLRAAELRDQRRRYALPPPEHSGLVQWPTVNAQALAFRRQLEGLRLLSTDEGERMELAARIAVLDASISAALAATQAAATEEALAKSEAARRQQSVLHGKAGGRPPSEFAAEWKKRLEKQRADRPHLSKTQALKKVADAWNKDNPDDKRSWSTIRDVLANAQKES